jgi:hypothetical protein
MDVQMKENDHYTKTRPTMDVRMKENERYKKRRPTIESKRGIGTVTEDRRTCGKDDETRLK